MKITVEMLKEHHACQPQIDLFAEMFPDGVEPTEELCAQYAELFDWGWAAMRLLPRHELAAFHDAEVAAWEAAYVGAKAHACKAYAEAIARAFGRLWEEYQS